MFHQQKKEITTKKNSEQINDSKTFPVGQVSANHFPEEVIAYIIILHYN